MAAISPTASATGAEPGADARIEALTQERGRALLQEVRRLERRMGAGWLYDRLTRLVLNDEALKIQLFRFVDVLPSLKTPDAVAQHLLEFLDQPDAKLPAGTRRLIQSLSLTTTTEWLLGDTTRLGVGLMAQHLIAGKNARQATGAIHRLRRQSMAFTLDLLGEAVTSEAEAENYQQEYLDLISALPPIVRAMTVNEQLDLAPWGAVPRANVSLKLSSLYSRFDPMAADDTVAAVKERLRPILLLARENGVFVNFDMEQNSLRGVTRRIFEEILCEDELLDWTDVGIVVQAYLREARDDLEKLTEWAKSRGAPVWVRLVKGAYWDYETIIAAQRGHPVPVFGEKAQTDANYEELTEYLLAHWETLRPAIATHNVRSAAHAQAVAERLQLPPRAVEYQVLFGMGEPIARALVAQGERVRVYLPFGELLPGMAYLVRRLLENTSNASFIRHIEQHEQSDEELLAPPRIQSTLEVPQTENNLFENEPVTDFDLPENQAKMRAALAAVERQLGFTVPIVINDQHENSPQIWQRSDPSDTRRIASRSCWATPEQAQQAIAAAQSTLPAWRATPVEERADLLRRVAARFRHRRFEIAAWQVYEVGKPWRDADADVAEAIDFCEYYAAQMECLDRPQRHDMPGEWNDYFYEPRGPAVIIAPWNFPLAILTGMSVAALVAGNPIVIKPSEQSARVGYFLMEALQSAGAPPGVAHFLPGNGESIGPTLVNDPRVALIAFTGSREVGLSIIRDAAVMQPGQSEIKRVIAELGGKNAIVVDEDADLDEAVPGVLSSAIGYSGQKCSACSRAIIIGPTYEPFCERLAEAVKSIRIGPASDPATMLGPVVDEEAQQRIGEYIEIGHREGRLLAQIEPDETLAARGYYVPAAVFTDCPPEGRLCQEEIFGPVLSVLRAPDLDTALKMAANSVYALTGGFYGRSPSHIERVRREFRVGNLYINRKITGALVERQPFGGAKLSGVGSKAGGPDYLLQFLVPRTITESVMRHGFAPTRGART